MVTMETKYTTLFLSTCQLHHLLYHLLYLPNLSSSWAFLSLPSITFFYYTCYCCMFSTHYNNKKTDKFRHSGLLLLLCVLCFYYALLIVVKPESSTNSFNSICTIYKSSRIPWSNKNKKLINVEYLVCCCYCIIVLTYFNAYFYNVCKYVL